MKEEDIARIRLLQYENLRKHFKKMTEKILGKDYYNMGADVYTCDEFICDDITSRIDTLNGMLRQSRFWNIILIVGLILMGVFR